MPANQRSDLYLMGLLHDVGKIGVDDAVLKKTGPLTPEEYRQIQSHVEIGVHILTDLKKLHHLLPGVPHHHESLDGTGYPGGLAGEAIPLEARILAVADSLRRHVQHPPLPPPADPVPDRRDPPQGRRASSGTPGSSTPSSPAGSTSSNPPERPRREPPPASTRPWAEARSPLETGLPPGYNGRSAISPRPESLRHDQPTPPAPGPPASSRRPAAPSLRHLGHLPPRRPRIASSNCEPTSPTPGRRSAAQRFRDHTAALFKKHGMENVGYWTPQDDAGKAEQLIYSSPYPSREAAKASWAAFSADPEWKRSATPSEQGRQDRQEGHLGLHGPDRLQPDQVTHEVISRMEEGPPSVTRRHPPRPPCVLPLGPAPDPGAHLAEPRRPLRGHDLSEVRELPEGRGFQVPGADQRRASTGRRGPKSGVVTHSRATTHALRAGGRLVGVPVCVVMPRTAPAIKKAATKVMGRVRACEPLCSPIARPPSSASPKRGRGGVGNHSMLLTRRLRLSASSLPRFGEEAGGKVFYKL